MIAELHDWLPFNFHQWPLAAQITILILLTFISEDLTTVAAGVLTAAGVMDWRVGFAGCFLGIWKGDAGLYWLARLFGRPLLKWRWVQYYFPPAAVERSELWFKEKGNAILWISRFLPGTRLATYVAAGLLRVPFGRFLLITGLACLVWILGVFWLAELLGPELVQWLKRFEVGGWALLLGIVAIFGLVRLFTSLLRPETRRKLLAKYGRWRHWEFWPAWLFYPPVVLYCAWLAIRYRGLALPTVANPGIEAGGLIGESKFATLKTLSGLWPDWTARACLISARQPYDRIRDFDHMFSSQRLSFPLILKPDSGQRGSGVNLIHSREQAHRYLTQTPVPTVVQEYAEGPHEVGVFYYRFPHEPQGSVFAITEKIFPTVTGDGHHTLEELIWNDPRARYVAARYLARFEHRRAEVVPKGHTIKLVEAGNHAQGCIFRDGMHLLTAALSSRIDAISQKLEGFFIGRYDIRYASETDLKEACAFKILELNGAASEATSIYDSRNSLAMAYRTLFRQWDLVFAIGRANRDRGHEPVSPIEVWKKWRQYFREAATHPLAD